MARSKGTLNKGQSLIGWSPFRGSTITHNSCTCDNETTAWILLLPSLRGCHGSDLSCRSLSPSPQRRSSQLWPRGDSSATSPCQHCVHRPSFGWSGCCHSRGNSSSGGGGGGLGGSSVSPAFPVLPAVQCVAGTSGLDPVCGVVSFGAFCM